MDKKAFVLLIVLSIQQLHFNTGVQILINPNKTVASDEKDVELSCKLDEKENGLKTVEVFQVTRKGDKAIVSLYPNNTISYMGADDDEYTATGKIKGTKSHLDVKILKADLEDSGVYNCVIKYTDRTGRFYENKAKGHLKVEDPQVQNINASMSELLEKIKNDEDAIKELEEREKEEDKKIAELEEKNQEQLTKLKELNQKEKELLKKVKEIEEKAEKDVKDATEKALKVTSEITSMNTTIKELIAKLEKGEKEFSTMTERESGDHKQVKDLEDINQKQEKAIAELREREAKLEQRVTQVGIEITEHLKKVTDMNKMQSRDKSVIVDLEAKENDDETKLRNANKHRTEIAENIRQLELKLETAIQTLKEYDTTETGSSVTDTTIDTSSGNGDDSERTGIDTPMIAFVATNEKVIARPHDDNIFIFPDVITQWGQGYDPSTGIFTAPHNGLYLISLLVNVDCNACYVKMQVLANDKILFRLRVGHKYDKPQVSASSPVDLKKGDQVKILTEKSSPDTVVHINRYSMLSGYLINAS